MSTKLLMSAQEYLSASFDGPDREFVDGEVVERSMGEIPHGALQTEIAFRLRMLAEQLSIRVLTEIRIQISASRYRVADIAVWRAGEIGSRIPTVPPFLAIEILSPEDRMVRVMPKI
jgi:Uma2 family endonuclease